MLKLIRLEWKKHHLISYIKGVVISILAIFTAVALMSFGSEGEGTPMFSDYAAFMSLTNIIVRIVFIIFSSIIMSRLVIDEYKSNTIQLMFSYPLQRQKILQAKLFIVFGFCFFSIILTTLVINLFIVILHPTIELFGAPPVRMVEMMETAPSVIINAFMIAGISLIPLYFGMRKKSAPSTITSSVVIAFLINSTISDGGSSTSLFQFIGVPIAFCLFGLIVGYLSFRNVHKLDVS